MTEKVTKTLKITPGSSLPEQDEAIARLITSVRGSLALIVDDETYHLLALTSMCRSLTHHP